MSIVATMIDQYPNPVGSRKVEAYSLVEASSPTVAAQAGAGTASGGTATITGDSCSGQVTLTTGTTIPAGGGTLFVVSLPNQLDASPIVLIGQGGANAAAYFSGTAAPYPVAGSGSQSFAVVGGSITPLTAYTFNYLIPGARVSVSINSKFLNKPDQVKGSAVRGFTVSGNTATIKVKPSFTKVIVELSSPAN